jgi:hypothetical protein
VARASASASAPAVGDQRKGPLPSGPFIRVIG